MSSLDRLLRETKKQQKEERLARVQKRRTREAIREQETDDELRQAFQDDKKGIS